MAQQASPKVIRPHRKNSYEPSSPQNQVKSETRLPAARIHGLTSRTLARFLPLLSSEPKKYWSLYKSRPKSPPGLPAPVLSDMRPVCDVSACFRNSFLACLSPGNRHKVYHSVHFVYLLISFGVTMIPCAIARLRRRSATYLKRSILSDSCPISVSPIPFGNLANEYQFLALTPVRNDPRWRNLST